MQLFGFLLLIVGVAGFTLTWLALISVAPMAVWIGIAAVGAIITMMTRRPGN
jgi:hypothetical protein